MICYFYCQSWFSGSVAPWIWMVAPRNDPKQLLDGYGPTRGKKILKTAVPYGSSQKVINLFSTSSYQQNILQDWALTSFFKVLFCFSSLNVNWLAEFIFNPLLGVICFFCFFSLIYSAVLINFCFCIWKHGRCLWMVKVLLLDLYFIGHLLQEFVFY